MTRVFISYVRENRREVDRICTFLRENGVEPWLDRESILPGTPWKDAILAAIRAGEYFIACFSSEYNSRLKSYMNEELNVAIAELRQRDPADVWFVPILLSGSVPEWEIRSGRTLRDLQWIDFQQNGRDRSLQMLLKALVPDSQEGLAADLEDTAGRSLVDSPTAEVVNASDTQASKAKTVRKRAKHAQIEIRRPREFFGKDAIYQVIVDDESRGIIIPGGNVKMKLRAGKHRIHLLNYKPFSGSEEMRALLNHPRFGAAGKDVIKTSNAVEREFNRGEHVVLLSTTGFLGMWLKEI